MQLAWLLTRSWNSRSVLKRSLHVAALHVKPDFKKACDSLHRSLAAHVPLTDAVLQRRCDLQPQPDFLYLDRMHNAGQTACRCSGCVLIRETDAARLRLTSACFSNVEPQCCFFSLSTPGSRSAPACSIYSSALVFRPGTRVCWCRASCLNGSGRAKHS